MADMAGKGNGRNQIGAGDLPFTAAGKLNFDRYDSAAGDYTGACLPFGHVRSQVVLFAVPGAFTPTCSLKHLPGFIEKASPAGGK